MWEVWMKIKKLEFRSCLILTWCGLFLFSTLHFLHCTRNTHTQTAFPFRVHISHFTVRWHNRLLIPQNTHACFAICHWKIPSNLHVVYSFVGSVRYQIEQRVWNVEFIIYLNIISRELTLIKSSTFLKKWVVYTVRNKCQARNIRYKILQFWFFLFSCIRILFFEYLFHIHSNTC
jgi:hypothetical protein